MDNFLSAWHLKHQSRTNLDDKLELDVHLPLPISSEKDFFSDLENSENGTQRDLPSQISQLQSSIGKSVVEQKQFEPLRQEERMKDAGALHCYNCDGEFRFLNGKHICRRCGRDFCVRCAQNTLPARSVLKGTSHEEVDLVEKVNVCDRCYREALAIPDDASTSGFQQSWKADMLYVNGIARRSEWQRDRIAPPGFDEFWLRSANEKIELTNDKADFRIEKAVSSQRSEDEDEDDIEDDCDYDDDDQHAPSEVIKAGTSPLLGESALPESISDGGRKGALNRRKRDQGGSRRFERLSRKERQARFFHSPRDSVLTVSAGVTSEEGSHHASDVRTDEVRGFLEKPKPPSEAEHVLARDEAEEDDTDSGMSKYYRVNQDGDRGGSYGDADTSNIQLWIPPPAECEGDEDAIKTHHEQHSAADAHVEYSVADADVEALSAGEECPIPLQALVDGHFRTLLEQLLSTEGLDAGGEEGWLEIICDLALQAAMLVKPDTSRGACMDPGVYVKIKCIACGRRKDSRVVDGVVCRKNVANRKMESDIRRPRLLILGGSLEYQREATQLASIDTLIKQEELFLEQEVKQIAARFERGGPPSEDSHGVRNVLLVEKSVAGQAQDLLLRSRISLVYNMKRRLLDRVAKCTGGQIAEDSASLAAFGHCRRFYTQRYVEDKNEAQGKKPISKTLMFFEGCRQPLGCTVLLMGAGTGELKKVKRVLQLAVFAAYHLALETSFLADERALPSKLPASRASPDFGGLPTGAAEWSASGRIAMLSAKLRQSGAVAMPLIPRSLFEKAEWLRGVAVAREADGRDAGSEERADCSGKVVQDLSAGYSTPAEPGQNILVSVSSRCLPKKVVCEPPKLRRIKYYSDSDMPLAQFLLDSLFNKDYRCKSCEKSTEAHVRVYTHKEGSLTISVRRIEPALPGTSDHIWLWHRCKRCVKIGGVAPSTKRVLMSEAARKLSFGKFLELSFSTHAAATREARCGHSLHRECLRFYGCQDMIASFSYAPMKLHSVHLPPFQLQFSREQDREWLGRELKDIAAKKEAFVAQVSGSLQSISGSVASSSAAADLPSEFEESARAILSSNERLLEEESAYLDDEMAAAEGLAAPVGHSMDILALNALRKEILVLSADWEKRLSCLTQELSQQRRSSAAPVSPEAEHGDVSLRPSGACGSRPPLASDADSCSVLVPALHSLADAMSGPPEDPSAAGAVSEAPTEVAGEDAGPALPVQPVSRDAPSAPPVDSVSEGHGEDSDGQAGLLHCEPSSPQPGEEGLPAQSAESKAMRDPEEWGAPGFVWTSGLVHVPQREKPPDCSEDRKGDRKTFLDRLLLLGDSTEAANGARPSGPVGIPGTPTSACSSVGGSPPKADDEQRPSRPLTPSLKPLPGSAGLPPLSSTATAAATATAGVFPEGGPHFPSSGGSDKVVPIYEDEPTSFIAFALCSEDYLSSVWGDSAHSNRSESDREPAAGSGRRDGAEESHSDPNSLLSPSQLHVKVQVPAEGSSRKKESGGGSASLHFSVTCFYARQFAALLQLCCGGGSGSGAEGEGRLQFVRSLCRCRKWHTQGGKSHVYFAKTLDDRFVVKEVQKKEMAAFLEFAREYFKYLAQCFSHGNPSCLAKIFGLFQVSVRGTVVTLMVMENLFYAQKISCIYDLKGSIRSRYNANASHPNAVLLDQNLLETMPTSPIFVGKKAKQHLERAVWNDTKFLADMDVMDYSMLLGVDEQQHVLVLGIIDFIRPYTWDKQLETWVKASGILGGPRNAAPTIISPDSYKSRFRKAMRTYFVLVPDQWTPPPLLRSVEKAEDRPSAGKGRAEPEAC